MTSFDRMQVKAPTSKRSSILGSDDARDEHYRSDIHMIENDSYYGSSDSSRRRKTRRDDQSWRKDLHERRSNGWDSDWGPSSSGNTEEKYVPVTIKLKESPEFMKHETEEGFYDRRDMKPIARLSSAWPGASEDTPEKDDMEVDSEAPRPPPKGAKPGKWSSDGDWIETAAASFLKPKPPPPPPPLPPSNQEEKELLKTIVEEKIPEWAKTFKAPPAPVVSNPQSPFVEDAPLKEHVEFDGHAAIKKGHPCCLCNEVMFFSGLAWTYCEAGPPVPGANWSRYQLKTVMPKNTDMSQVLELQRVKDKAIRKRLEMSLLTRPRGVHELEDEFHGLKTTNDGSIRLVCFKCWNESEGTDKYVTSEGKPSAAHEKHLARWERWHFKIDPYVYQKLTDVYAGASDWVTAVGPNDNVAVLYACSGCNNAPLRTNGWLKAKTCSAGSYEKTQWHCPHCALKWKWGLSAQDRWIIIYSGKNDVNPVHFTWGPDKEDWSSRKFATRFVNVIKALDEMNNNVAERLEKVENMEVFTTQCQDPATHANYPSCGLICPDHRLSVQYVGQPVKMGIKPSNSRHISHEEFIQLCIVLLSMIGPASYVTIERLDRKVTGKAREHRSQHYATIKRIIDEDVQKQRRVEWKYELSNDLKPHLTTATGSYQDAQRPNTGGMGTLVGQLLWVSQLRVDILFAVKELSRALQQPYTDDLKNLKQLLSHIEGTTHYKVTLAPKAQHNEQGQITVNIDSHADSDWEGCSTTRKSTSDTITSCWGTHILHLSRTQSTIALPPLKLNSTQCDKLQLKHNTSNKSLKNLQFPI
eukprot:6490758-Amphidinium_carterae.2